MTLAADESFRCVPYATVLRRSACGARHAKMNAATKPEDIRVRVSSGKCVGCDVGAAHAKGRRHVDAPLVQLRLVRPELRTAIAPPHELSLGDVIVAKLDRAANARRAGRVAPYRNPKAAPLEVERQPVMLPPAPAEKEDETMKLYTYKGEELRLSEIAKRIGMSKDVLRKRVTSGWDIERATSTPVNPPGVHHGERGASADKGGASAKTEKAAKPRRSSMRDTVVEAARSTASTVGAAGVLRALGFQVDELAVPAGVALLVRESA